MTLSSNNPPGRTMKFREMIQPLVPVVRYR